MKQYCLDCKNYSMELNYLYSNEIKSDNIINIWLDYDNSNPKLSKIEILLKFFRALSLYWTGTVDKDLILQAIVLGSEDKNNYYMYLRSNSEKDSWTYFSEDIVHQHMNIDGLLRDIINNNKIPYMLVLKR